MKIVCASSLAMGREAFATIGDVEVVPEKAITSHTVREADALITRSKVKIDRELLDGSRVAFAGTATAGTDHMDLDYLNAKEIGWTAAPGCNANSVAEYLVAALLNLAHRRKFQLEGKTIAVVGIGHIGKRVMHVSSSLGMTVLLNDPPLFAQTGNDLYRTLDEVLPRADIVTLHVPLLETGPFATRHLGNSAFFRRMKRGAIFVNAARGEVVDSSALMKACDDGIVKHAVLDVFENEPSGQKNLLDRADLITPHIAGYSFEGKVNGTHMVYRQACGFFEMPEAWSPPPAQGLPDIVADAAGRSDEDVLCDIVRQSYDIESDDASFRAGLADDDKARGRHFEKLRAEYPVRHEFAQHHVRLQNASDKLRQKVRSLGFQSLEK